MPTQTIITATMARTKQTACPASMSPKPFVPPKCFTMAAPKPTSEELEEKEKEEFKLPAQESPSSTITSTPFDKVNITVNPYSKEGKPVGRLMYGPGNICEGPAYVNSIWRMNFKIDLCHPMNKEKKIAFRTFFWSNCVKCQSACLYRRDGYMVPDTNDIFQVEAFMEAQLGYLVNFDNVMKAFHPQEFWCCLSNPDELEKREKVFYDEKHPMWNERKFCTEDWLKRYLQADWNWADDFSCNNVNHHETFKAVHYDLEFSGYLDDCLEEAKEKALSIIKKNKEKMMMKRKLFDSEEKKKKKIKFEDYIANVMPLLKEQYEKMVDTDEPEIIDLNDDHDDNNNE